MSDALSLHRKRLFSLAYRMLGSRSDAEDAVQDAAVKWAGADQQTIRDPEAWLVTVTTRAAIDIGRRRSRDRANYIGPWLPEPVDEGPENVPMLAESLRLAFLLMLEKLTPAERAAFLLREVFDSDYADIAQALETSADAARQHVSRAKRHLADGRKRFVASPEAEQALLSRFGAALAAGNHAEMLTIMAPDAALYSDGGGKVIAARNVINGADRIARFFFGIAAKFGGRSDWRPVMANGAPALLSHENGIAEALLSIATDGSRITGVFVQRNPEKLAGFTRH